MNDGLIYETQYAATESLVYDILYADPGMQNPNALLSLHDSDRTTDYLALDVPNV